LHICCCLYKGVQWNCRASETPLSDIKIRRKTADTARTTGGQSKNKDLDIDDTSTSSSEENNEDLAEPPDSFAMLAGASWYVE